MTWENFCVMGMYLHAMIMTALRWNSSGNVITHELCYVKRNSDNSQMNISFNSVPQYKS